MKRKIPVTSDDAEASKRTRIDSSSGNSQTIGHITGSAGQIVTSQTGFEVDPQQLPSGDISKRQRKKKGKAKADSASTTALTVPAPQTSKRRENIRKLAPPRPFPTVPTSVSASGPKSAHTEGKNFICITRHTPLAAYLSRCKKLFVEDGYNVLHLHAMGAAIPHLLTLSVSLPSILPFARNEIQLEVRTGTIEVIDEVLPEDEDEDISMRTRGKGGVSVILKLNTRPGAGVERRDIEGSGGKGKQREIIVIQEQDQEDDEMNQN